MVTVTCNTDECPQNGIDYNIRGTPPFVECGGCRQIMQPRDPRPDPPKIDPPE